MLDGPAADYALMRFSTARIAPREQMDAWRHILSRKLLRVSVDGRMAGPSFRAETKLRILDGLRYGNGLFDASVNRRERHLVASDNDDLLILINQNDRLGIRQMEQDVSLGPGEACLLSCAEPGVYERGAAGRISAIRIPRNALVHSVKDIERHLGRPIPSGMPLLRLLTGYLEAIDRTESYPAAEERALIVQHVHDILALLLGAAGDEGQVAAGRGLKAARFRALKDDVARNIDRRDLTAASVASRHNMSVRSVQRAFEQQGTTFTAYLLELRLKAMHRKLGDRQQAARAISDLALDCGFGDMSHFNHSFRRRFGATPREVRDQARKR